MSYLLDKKLQRKKYQTLVFFAMVLGVLFYFRSGIFNGLSHVSATIFRPFLVFKNNSSDKLGEISNYFSSKNSLSKQIQDLEASRADVEARMANYDSVLSENESLKEILGRKDEKLNLTLAAILGRDTQNPYDTLIIDVGESAGVATGERVFAYGNIPVGRVGATFQNLSKVVLFSTSKELTSVTLRDTQFDLVGRGGGNFELVLPRDFELEKGDQAVLPGLVPYVLAKVVSIISDPRDSFKKALLTSPINIRELKFVEVER